MFSSIENTFSNQTNNHQFNKSINQLNESNFNKLKNINKKKFNNKIKLNNKLITNHFYLNQQQFFTSTNHQQSNKSIFNQYLINYKIDQKIENVNEQFSSKKFSKLIITNTKINLINFNLFRFKFKLWLLIILILNCTLIKHSLAQLNQEKLNLKIEQQKCLALSEKLAKQKFNDNLNNKISLSAFESSNTTTKLIDNNLITTIDNNSNNLCVNETTIKIGYLTNFNSSTGQPLGITDVGAIDYAISKVNTDNLIGNGRRLKLIVSDTHANPVYSTKSMLNQVSEGAVAFIGPDNTCLTEATVAAALNLPMISYKCSDQKVSDKKTYHTFARTVAPDAGIVNSVLVLLEYHQWFQFSLIYKDKENFRKIAESLIEKSNSRFKIEPRHHFPDTSECCALNNQQCCQFTFKEIIESAAKQTRIWVFIGDRKDVKEFIKLFKNYNYHLNKHFIIIVDSTDWDDQINIRYLPEKPEKLEDDNVYRSTMMITFSPPNKKKYEMFVKEIEKENIKNGRKRDHNLKTFVTLYACYLYDAVILYAKALSKILERNICANDGEAIIKQLINSNSYLSICGSQMKINENGDVFGNYTVFAYKQYKPDDNEQSFSYNNLREHRNQFVPIGMFKFNNEQQQQENHQQISSFTLNYKFHNQNHNLKYEPINNQTVDWINGEQPVAKPKCGFDNSLCKQEDIRKKITIALSIILGVLIFFTVFIYRSYRHEQEIQGLLWNIKIEKYCDEYSGFFNHTNSTYDTQHSQSDYHQQSTIATTDQVIQSTTSDPTELPKRQFTRTIDYNGRIVAVKQLKFINRNELSIDMKKEMSIIKNLHHDNICQFIGADLEHLSQLNRIYLVTEYCEKGSLLDVLSEERFPLGTIITASFIFDLLSALSYLHKSEIKFHGNLKSSNCLLTSRICLKVSDFGLHQLRTNARKCDESSYFDLLWKSPEQLRENDLNSTAKQNSNNIKDSDYINRMQKGDIYSFAIILHEIIVREGPFNMRIKGETEASLKLKTEQIIESLKNGCSFISTNKINEKLNELVRPIIPDNKCEQYIADTMRECWAEMPEDRLDIQTIKNKLKPLQETLQSNVMNDTNTLLLTNYNENLELLVNQRTKQVILLLQRMLPNSVAQQLMDGKTVETESFDSVTIFFSDIVGFTTIARQSEPRQIVDMLNNLYTLFDEIVKHYDVYKVETIGDAYMVGSGFPKKLNKEEQETNHAVEIANMALELLESTRSFKIEHLNKILELRIGIHTGPICAGVIGKTMPRYCVFGDTVNYANRMESTGEARKIHISDATKKILEKNDDYLFECRGEVFVKGIGNQTTWWLTKNPKKINKIKASSSKDPLFLKNCIKSDNNFQTRRSSNFMLRERSIDFAIRQNAIKSNRNLISCDDNSIENLLPNDKNRQQQQKKVNHSENHLHNCIETPPNLIELPNGTKCNFNPLVNLNGKFMNDKRKQYYDFNDKLINSEFIDQQLNDNSFEPIDSYDNSLNLDSLDSTKKDIQLKNKMFGKSKDNNYYLSDENLNKKSKSKSCTDLQQTNRIF